MMDEENDFVAKIFHTKLRSENVRKKYLHRKIQNFAIIVNLFLHKSL